MAAASPLPISVSEYLQEARSFADPTTGIRLDLDSLFASIDDALGDPGRP